MHAERVGDRQELGTTRISVELKEHGKQEVWKNNATKREASPFAGNIWGWAGEVVKLSAIGGSRRSGVKHLTNSKSCWKL